MGSVEATEKETYEAMFAVDSYSNESPGEVFAGLFMDMAQPCCHDSVLDAGCGSGKGAVALSKMDLSVMMTDLVDARVEEASPLPFCGGVCLWSNLAEQFGVRDWVFCCDVLEHVPPEFTMLVVSRLLRVVRKGAFFSIALEPDNFGALIGQQLHKTVRPFIWWRDRLAELGGVRECRDLLSTGVYLVEPAR